MKTTPQITTNEDLLSFLSKDLGLRAKDAVYFLKKRYRVETVKALQGIVCRRLPRVTAKTAKKKCLAPTYMASIESIQSELIIDQLRRAMRVSLRDAERVYNRCIRLKDRFQTYNYSSSWAFGAVKPPRRINQRGSFWSSAPEIKIEKGFWVVPEYNSRNAFDQGERGTCVANAICKDLDYQLEIESSREFQYHQDKMLDGIPDEEGTYIETAARVISDKSIIDIGTVEETVWPYNPYQSDTTHHGPPPEKAYSTKRLFSAGEPVFVRETSKVNDIIYLLNYKTARSGLTSSRNKTRMTIIGIAVYESFFSLNTSETGMITMPLPGETIVGYHAMAVCGYDSERRLFLVINSWGPHWARNNDKGYAGHAWIPFEYIENYCHVGVALQDMRIEHMEITEEERLYNSIYEKRPSFRKAAIKRENKSKIKKDNKRRNEPKDRKRLSLAGWLLRAAILILLWVAYKDPVLKAKDKVVEIFGKYFDRSEGSHSKPDFTVSINNLKK